MQDDETDVAIAELTRECSCAPSAGHPMSWVPEDPGVLLHCAQEQCFAALMPVPVWQAQQHRENLGLDVPTPAAGWPLRRLDGLPVPDLVPVTDGHPWWGLIRRERLHACQIRWSCQVCGLELPLKAWVVAPWRPGAQRLGDAPPLRRACPRHLPAAGRRPRLGELAEAEVTASQLRTTDGGDRIGTGTDLWPEYWILADGR